MIEFEKFRLDNGLRVIVHSDTSTPIAALNILYDVGARDEQPDKTGFAHLFEHLMFGGSVNIPDFDAPLQKAGGENNAYTTNDITNYYLTLPINNLETGFWLESDRMLSLAFSEKSLEVQRNVVIEEFRQNYLNQPYGDEWLLLRPLAYRVHPYRWSTIGKEISHIENATMRDVKKFYDAYYCPNNAIMVVAGNVNIDEVKQLCEKWFAGIEAGEVPERKLSKEPKQEEARTLDVKRDVPYDAIYKAYHVCARRDEDYHAADLLSDILSRGKSSRLFNELVKSKKLFSEIDAYLSGSLDEGLLVIEGKLMKGVKMEAAENAIREEVEKFKSIYVGDEELQKVKNKIESYNTFEEMSVLNKATNLAMFELLGDAADINREVHKYFSVTSEQIMTLAKQILNENNCATLHYYSSGK